MDWSWDDEQLANANIIIHEGVRLGASQRDNQIGAKLPDRLAVGRLPPAVVHAIVTGTTPLLQALGRQPDTRTALAT